MTEEWKTIPNFSSYECSTLGNFRNKSSKRKLNPGPRGGGYLGITLSDKNGNRKKLLTHILIAKTWIKNPLNKRTVDHINRKRDDNRVSNLRWFTHKEQAGNINYSKRKVNNGRPIWKCDKDTGEKIKLYNSVTEAAKSIGKNAGHSHIVECIKGKINTAYGFKWKYPKDPKIEGETFKFYLETTKCKYYVSNKGRVKNKNENRILKPIMFDGYCHVLICSKYLRVHDLVGKLFIDNPNNYDMVNHKDGKRDNNDVNNLEWTDNDGNIEHAIKTGLVKRVKKIVRFDLTGKILKVYNSCADASKELGVIRGSINKCCQGTIKACGNPKLYFKFLEESDDITNKKISKNYLNKWKAKKEKKKYVIVKKKIEVYDKNDKLLETCKDIAEASRKYKTHPETIAKHAKGITKYSMLDYKFKYAE